jgi:ATP-dependent DNA ligase
MVCDENGLADFELIRGHRTADAVNCAFDLLELDGRDLRRRPIEERKGLLTQLLHGSLPARLRRHCEQTPRINLSPGPLTALGQSQKSECASGEA